MALVINHNLMAMNSARNLSNHYGALSTSTQRLSSGLRINSSADDAAGLAVRELMRSDVSTLNQGIRNANDAISMIQTADGALQVVDEKLIRMKELAEQAATGTYTDDQRAIINSEYQAMALEIQRISNSTDFNGIYLLNGNLSGTFNGSGINSTGQAKIHFGTGNDSAEDYYYVTIDSSKIENLFSSNTGTVGEYKAENTMFYSTTSSDIQLNTTTAGDQSYPVSAGLANGGFVSVWQSQNQDGSGYGIYGQVFDGNGSKVGNEFLANTTTTNDQTDPSIAALNDGGFVVSWTSAGQDGSGTGIYAQTFNSSYNKVNGEIQVNSVTTNDQYRSNTINTDDGFLTTWTSQGQDGSLDGIYGKFYDSSGNVLVSEFKINATTSLDQRYPAATKLANGNYAVSWFSPDGSNWGVYGQIINKDGNPVGSEFRANTTTNDLQNFQSITELSDGKFVIGWNSHINGGPEFQPTAQIFNSDGSSYGSEFQINSTYMTNQMYPHLASVNENGFVATWSSVGQDGSGWGTYAQMYDNKGSKVGEEFLVNKTTIGNQYVSDITSLSTGGFIVSYHSDDGQHDTSGIGAFAALYTPVIDVATQQRAQTSLDNINSATTKCNAIRANLGAMQNRLENTISNLQIQAENLQTAESQISDTDVAQEMTSFVREQILAQSAVAMLAQANSLPKMALQIITG